jgi:hypothetical protein
MSNDHIVRISGIWGIFPRFIERLSWLVHFELGFESFNPGNNFSNVYDSRETCGPSKKGTRAF